MPTQGRVGGRAKGTPNKATVKRLQEERIAKQAQDAVNDAAHKRKKLGKDVLEDYMLAFAAVAAVFQNRVATAFSAGQTPSKDDLDAFEKWGGLTAQTANSLAAFQSPKFKAIAVMAPPPGLAPVPVDKDNVVTLDDPVALARVYQRMVRQVR